MQSKCVIILAADKDAVLGEPARVHDRAGLFAVSDVLADPGTDEPTRQDMTRWTDCIAGVRTRGQFSSALAEVGRSMSRLVRHAGCTPTLSRRSSAPARHPRPVRRGRIGTGRLDTGFDVAR